MVVVDRAITVSTEVRSATEEILEELAKEEIKLLRVMTDC